MHAKKPRPLQELLQIAETTDKQPEAPIGGIPHQRLPSYARLILRSLILPFLHLELWAEQLAKWLIRPPFKQVGTCKRRGACCHYILFPETKGFFKTLFTFWYTEINGFYERKEMNYEYEGKKVLVMGCRYLKKDGSCSNYFFRPKVCRTWPLIAHFGYPKILKGCGYQAKLTKAGQKKYPGLHIINEEES